MKKISLVAAAFALGTTAAQAQTEWKKLPSISVDFFMNDFYTADYIRKNSLNEMFRNNIFSETDHMTPGLSLGYANGVTNNIDLGVKLGGSFVKYPVPDKPLKTDRSLLLDLTAVAKLKVLSDRHLFNPYLQLGFGASKYGSSFAAIAPVGLGFQFRIVDGFYLDLGSQYRIPITSLANYHFQHSIGFVKSLRERVVTPIVPPAPPIVDRDGDGVNDDVDRCPDTPGLAALQGCPDRDGDGITDIDDKCPDVAGTLKYQGCPIPDSDGDGINDEMDKCPNEKGVARYEGCPIPDTDGDGVNDEEDKCPSRPGPASNYGCPEIKKEVIEKINYASKNVFFATGSYKLLAKSNKSLNDVVAIMKADETLNLDIDGHTDSQGSDELNQTLSENRAKSVLNYLVSKGVAESRLKATGYGESKPVADNNTAAGRAKNRRTEMTARNY